MTIDEAIEFFAQEKKILNRIIPLAEVGLGYVHLGQSSNTLSGGEAQRIRLAALLDEVKFHKSKIWGLAKAFIWNWLFISFL